MMTGPTGLFIAAPLVAVNFTVKIAERESLATEHGENLVLTRTSGGARNTRVHTTREWCTVEVL